MIKVLVCPNCGYQRLGGLNNEIWCLNGDCAFIWTGGLNDYEEAEGEN